MSSDNGTALVSFHPPTIWFRIKQATVAEAPLARLRRFLVVSCFDPEVAPGPDPSTFDLLDFGDTYWLVPDGSAERYLDTEWADHLLATGGYFRAEAGALPFPWRQSYLLLFKDLYRPRASVVPAEPLSFLTLHGPLDPRRIAEANRERFQRSLTSKSPARE